MYIIVTLNNYIHKFEELVNEKIADGFVPVGGVCATTHQGSGTITFYQALHKPHAPVFVQPALEEISTLDATDGALEFAREVFGDYAEAKLLSLQNKLARRVTKSDARALVEEGAHAN